MNGKIVLKTVLVISGSVFFVWFLCLAGMNYGNIGSKTGFVMAVLAIFCGFRFERISEYLSYLDKKKQRALMILPAIIILPAVLTTSVMYLTPLKYKPCRTMIILGCGVNDDGSPTIVEKRRLDRALEYLREYPETAIVAAGGLRDDFGGYQEADSMADYLTAHGINEKMIYKEEKSSSTYENINYSAEIINENGLSKEVLIVTDRFHQYRSVKFAENAGLEPYSLPVKTDWYIWPAYYIREMYAVLGSWIFRK